MLTTHFFPNPIHSDLWQMLIEQLDSGVIVLGAENTVDYANAEAARLFGYPKDAVIGLDLEDFASLCYHERLDGYAFAKALGNKKDPPGEVFIVHTADRRLRIKLERITVEEEQYTVIMVREVDYWRAELVAETILSDDMHSPLQFAANYAETLVNRVSELAGYSFEIRDLARIVRESVERALRLWKQAGRFYDTAPATAAGWSMYPIDIRDAFNGAAMEAYQTSFSEIPDIELNIPEELPAIRASSPHLHGALTALLEEGISKLEPEDSIVVTAQERLGSAHVTIALHAPNTAISSVAFDSLPCAIAEQTIIRHGGRVWVVNRQGSFSAFSFTLPLWDAPEQSLDRAEDQIS